MSLRPGNRETDAARWSEVRALFDELADATGGTRERRLAAVDPDLRQAVCGLLEADTDAEARLSGMFGAVPPLRDPLGLAGRTVSHFEVRAPLGAGGMGVVYAAEDTRLGRMVALKVPLPERHLDASGRRRFLNEARAAAALDHPNLCSIHEVGESEEGILFLAMPLYRGETLQARLQREGSLPLDEAVSIARQIACGLAAAHAEGIVHRDLKPGNVMLLPDGLVKVLDFGLAKARAVTVSATGGVLGTAAYMAPEQIRNLPVDGRTDLWALGVVLYEMVAGRKPFRGEHDASLAHAIVHDDPLRPGDLRVAVPAGLEALILSLLAKDPSRRPADAAEVERFLGAVAAGAVPGPLRPRQRARLLAGVAAAAIVVLTSLLLAGRDRAGTASRLTGADLVVVAPFDAADPELQVWREGLADILSRNLDGAGPIRSVAPSRAFRAWNGRADRPGADALGARTGAGIVVFGTIVRRGADSVGVRLAVLDRSRGVIEGDFEVAGAEQRLGELADSLGVRILLVLGQRRPIASSLRTSIGSRSFPAIKEFLRAEQFYRRGEVDSALLYYDRAIAEDSTFALALRRMGWTLGSGAATSWRYGPANQYIRRAVRYNRGLSPKDSLLLLSDSLGQVPVARADSVNIVESVFRSISLLEELVRRYPDDAAIWYELGERYAHTPRPAAADNRATLAAFDRAIALDSGFAPAYMHTIRTGYQVGGEALARRYAQAYVSRGLPRVYTPALHLVQQIIDSGGVLAPGVREAIQSARASSLAWLGDEHFRWATDTAETAVTLFREALEGGHEMQGASRITADTLMQRQQLALALAFRGHLAEAARMDGALLRDADLSPFGHRHDPFPDLARFGVLDSALIARTIAQGIDGPWSHGGSATVPPRYLRSIPWLAQVGDARMLERIAVRGDSIVREARPTLEHARARYFAAAARAYLALVRKDTAEALGRFGSIPDSLCVVGLCQDEKLVEAQLMAAGGDVQGAAALLDAWEKPGLARPLDVLAALERARLAEQLRDDTTAVRHYQFVIDAWRRPDARLLPFVEEARQGLGRVGGE